MSGYVEEVMMSTWIAPVHFMVTLIIRNLTSIIMCGIYCFGSNH
jgi:hypothetical protein